MSEKMKINRALDWLKQAENDYVFAQKGNAEGFYSQSCFLAQQAGEKAIKAIAYSRNFEVRGHSIYRIAQDLNFNGEVEDSGKTLDMHYVTSRYPDALPLGAPFEIFTKKMSCWTRFNMTLYFYMMRASTG
jgi:HEPN domain-containing protein